MNIISKQNNEVYEIIIEDGTTSCKVLFSTLTRSLVYLSENSITKFLRNNEYQFRKILHNKRKDSFYPGFSLKFALRNNKDMEAFNDKSKVLYIDKRNDIYDINVVTKEIKNTWKLFTDGSCPDNLIYGGYSVLIQDPNGDYSLHTGNIEHDSSNFLELMAVIKGLEILDSLNIKEIRLVTDSQYVRKGVTEWLPNWQLNDWHTVNGEKAKNIEYWQILDNLLDNKYLELQWVKAHSGHFENTICDLYAKETVKNIDKRIRNDIQQDL